jgi:hypothetical protein
MTDSQIQPAPARPPEIQLSQRTRQRALPAQISTALLRPVLFFRTLPLFSETRQWFWVALLVLALNGFVAVRQEALQGGPAVSGGDFGGDFGAIPEDPAFGGDPLGGDFGGDLSGLPPGGAPIPDIGGGGGADTSATWTTALLAASSIVLIWLLQTVILTPVLLFNGRAPRLAQNLHIAIWASVPLALLAALQLVYYWAGGAVGEPGLTGVMLEWDGFAAQTPFMQAVLLSLASRFTLFWLWSLLLLYFGARFALWHNVKKKPKAARRGQNPPPPAEEVWVREEGKPFAAFLVVVVWAVAIVMLPVATGAITAPEPEILLEEEMMGDGFGGEFMPEEMFPEGEMPMFEEEMPEGFLLEEEPPLIEGEMPEGEFLLTPEVGEMDSMTEGDAAAEFTPEAGDMDSMTEGDAAESMTEGETGGTTRGEASAESEGRPAQPGNRAEDAP